MPTPEEVLAQHQLQVENGIEGIRAQLEAQGTVQQARRDLAQNRLKQAEQQVKRRSQFLQKRIQERQKRAQEAQRAEGQSQRAPEPVDFGRSQIPVQPDASRAQATAGTPRLTTQQAGVRGQGSQAQTPVDELEQRIIPRSRGFDVVNTILGLAGKEPVGFNAPLDPADQALVRARRARVRQLQLQNQREQAEFLLENDRKERALTFNMTRDLINQGGLPPSQALVATRAFNRGDDETFNRIAGRSTKRRMAQAKIRAEEALTEQRESRIDVNRARAKQLGLENEQLRLEAMGPLDRIGGVPVPEGLTPANVFSDFEKVFDATGRVKDEFSQQAANAQRLMLKSGTILAYNVDKPQEGLVESSQAILGEVFPSLRQTKTQAVPVTEPLKLLLQEGNDELDATVRSEARDKLARLNLFNKTNGGRDLIPVYREDPLHPNADASRALENFSNRLTGASPDAIAGFLDVLESRVGQQELRTMQEEGLLGPGASR